MKKNIILIFSDQQRGDTLGLNNCPLYLTPNIDNLGKEGINFEYAFTNQPVCGPARSCLFTGKYATETGVWRNGIGIKPEELTIAKLLKENGYKTAYIGKWHLSPHEKGIGPVPNEYRGGFEYWKGANVLEHTSHPYEGEIYDEKNNLIKFKDVYRVDFLTEKAIEFIKETKQPFFLTISYLEPHQQNDWNKVVAPEGYKEIFKNPYVPADLKFFPGDWFEQLPDYYGCIKRIDECVGRILEILKDLNLFENTIIIFTSDHGCHFRTRNGEYKRSCHESSIRIPLVIGGGIEKKGNIKEMVQLIDIPKTILEIADAKIPESFKGKSLIKIAEGKTKHEEIFIQISESMVARAIRTERWKYCVVASEKDGWNDSNSNFYEEYQLYDLYSDPYELVNLAGRREYKEISENLRERLKRKIKEIEGIEVEIKQRKLYP
ncbi:MAG: sulfatase-like hydrolase/transferase [bacterium]|nr:sulfatase-like hydrolase/transferase [bacterium]MCX7916940.1 sulfatase-like hydrolase/transferase [bacterium]MDW8164597.1 sulfatase-like hydrolase/transferase [Candidatus Omnitrophota bacterium]